MKRSGIQGACLETDATPDSVSLHPGYISNILMNRINDHNPVARIERSEIREMRSREIPDFAALYPGYNTDD